ncbi:bifunctional WD40 repeat [Babesia duncani]|uniref:Bifunctional WD40 repeat n=1 Tax=Babesia duncani TaxID=323732 RepID=A0AAD9UQP1_9APIC|nr:bifunctional WD40 repeat [Babesia duncani]
MQILDSQEGPVESECIAEYTALPNSNLIASLIDASTVALAVSSNLHAGINILGLDPSTRALELTSRIETSGPLESFVQIPNKEKHLLFLAATRSSDNKTKLEILGNTGATKTTSVETAHRNIKKILLDPHSDDKIRCCIVSSEYTCILHAAPDLEIHEPFRRVNQNNSNWLLYTCGRFDPHHSNLIALGIGNKFEICDLRQSDGPVVKNGPFETGSIFDLDYNTNVPNELLTVGEDQNISVWDLRSTLTPKHTFPTLHGHWVFSININPIYDQLILTSGFGGLLVHDMDEVLLNYKCKALNSTWIHDAWHFGACFFDAIRLYKIPTRLRPRIKI